MRGAKRYREREVEGETLVDPYGEQPCEDGQIWRPGANVMPEAISPGEKPDISVPKEFTPLQKRFLIAYARHGNAAKACRESGASYSAYRLWRNEPVFAEILEEARQIAGDNLEAIAYERAVHGWLEPQVSAGKLVTVARKYDHKLLDRLMTAAKPEKYRERHDVTTGGIPLLKVVELDKDAYEAI